MFAKICWGIIGACLIGIIGVRIFIVVDRYLVANAVIARWQYAECSVDLTFGVGAGRVEEEE